MSDSVAAFLGSWEFRPIILIFLASIASLFTLGWFRLRRRNPNFALAATWRLFSYWAGLILLFLALVSPIETLSGQLFLMHMVQHLLIAMFAPPLLLFADPMPIMMWGLPLPVRKEIGRIFLSKKAPVRPYLIILTQPAVAWFVYFLFLWGWHDPSAYNATLRNSLVHDLEHMTFFWSAMLLWWHITGAGPVLHKRFSYIGRIAFTLGCVPANMIAGVVIALADHVIYTYYESIPFRTWGLSVLEDQRIGGAIMWIPGSMMYVIAVIALTTIWLQAQEKALKHSAAASHKESLPGMEQGA